MARPDLREIHSGSCLVVAAAVETAETDGYFQYTFIDEYSLFRYLEAFKEHDIYSSSKFINHCVILFPYATSQKAKKTWGYLAYLGGAAGALKDIKPVHAEITCDGETFEDDILVGAVMNTTSMAGLIRLSPKDVMLDDGRFELLLVRDPKGFGELCGDAKRLLMKDFSTDSVKLLHASNISFKFDRKMSWTCDGEAGGEYDEVSVINHHAALRLLV